MKSRASRRFWERFDSLPRDVQTIARRAFRLWQDDPWHPSLHFKQLRPGRWSARVGMSYRALASTEGDGVILWFWIGSHAEYNRLVNTH
jgi:hypothetical protein